MGAIGFQQLLVLLEQAVLASLGRQIAGFLRGGDGFVKFSRLRKSRRQRADANDLPVLCQFAGVAGVLDGPVPSRTLRSKLVASSHARLFRISGESGFSFKAAK